MENGRKSFKDNLFYYMQQQDIDRAQLAKDIGVSYNTICSWFSASSKYPRIETINVLANYFGCSVSDLTGDKSRSSAAEISADAQEIVEEQKKKAALLQQLLDLASGMHSSQIEKMLKATEYSEDNITETESEMLGKYRELSNEEKTHVMNSITIIYEAHVYKSQMEENLAKNEQAHFGGTTAVSV